MHRTARPHVATSGACAVIVVLSITLLAASPLASPGLPDAMGSPLYLAQVTLLSALGVAGPGALLYRAPIAASPTAMVTASPFAHAVASASLLGLPLQSSLKVAIGLAMLLAAASTVLAMRRLMSPLAATLASAAYLCSPVLLQAAYTQGAYDRLLALALLPACLWGLLLLVGGALRLGFVVLSLSLALALASDTATALALAPVLAAVALGAANRPDRRAAAGIALALLVSALLAAPGWAYRSGLPSGSSQSVTFSDLLAIPQTADARAANPEYPQGFGGHLVLLAVPCLALVGLHDDRAKALRSAVVVLVVSAGALLAGTAVVSAIVSPAALLGVGALALATLVGAAADAWSASARRQTGWVAVALLATALGAAPYLFPARPFVDWSGLSPLELLSCISDDSSQSPAASCPSSVAQRFAPTMVPAGGLSLVSVEHGHLVLQAVVDEPSAIVLPVSGIEGWQVLANGRPLTAAAAQHGFVAVDAPGTTHAITIEAEPEPDIHWPSLAALAGMALLLLGCLRLPAGRALVPGVPAQDGVFAALALGSFLLLAAKVLYVEPHTTLFRLSSPPGRALGAAHEAQVSFADSLALIGYTMQRNLPPQGEQMQVTLYWQPPGPYDSDVSVSVSLVSPTTGQTMLRSTQTRPGGMPASLWSASEYLIDRHSLPLPADLPAVSYDLRVEVRDVATGATLPTHDGSGSAILEPVQVLYHLPLDITRFPGDRWYGFGESIRLIGYKVAPQHTSGGGNIGLTLFWRTEGPVPARMTRFADLVAEDGRIVAQVDDWPVGGMYPTDRWLPQHNIADSLQIRAPMSATAGVYRIVVGLHDPETLSLPTVSTRSGNVIETGSVTLPGTVVIQ